MKSPEKLQQLSSQPDETLYRELLPYLAEDGFFRVLEGGSFVEFHKKLSLLSEEERGTGIGLALMAQVNISGRILEMAKQAGSQKAAEVLQKIIEGKAICSTGVTEPGWKGRLKNLQSRISEAGDLNFQKGFLTNGYGADYFIIIAKDEKRQTYVPVLIPVDSSQMSIERIHTEFTPEATHCRARADKLKILEEDILPLEYEAHALEYRLSEILSLTAIFCGFGKKLLRKLKENGELKLLSEEDKREVFYLHEHLQNLEARIWDISGRKDKGVKMEEEFPFGLEATASVFFSGLDRIFGKEKVSSLSKDRSLFELKDPLNEILYRKAILRFFR
ncbi:MAG: hypothetical protein H7A25_09495 [Leptospiraceae bacterium]|nr:hypothetical protein [Leptospiraceae bacterium]MCP5500124.1 hypothetical protein [Leptospiraceae bacterium]